MEPVPGAQERQGRKESGVVVTEVKTDSPADRAGLREGDIIREINKKPIHMVQDFERLVDGLEPKSRVLLLITRGNGTIFLSVSPE